MPPIETNGITVHYLDAGQGSPVVWLPGGNDHTAMALYAHDRLFDHYCFTAVSYAPTPRR